MPKLSKREREEALFWAQTYGRSAMRAARAARREPTYATMHADDARSYRNASRFQCVKLNGGPRVRRVRCAACGTFGLVPDRPSMRGELACGPCRASRALVG